MREEVTTVTVSEQNVEIDQNVLRAVYALNMCTVSVSQIIDYNDAYILEQEYDAILNNLNLEKMPKADALKNILVELLNTITFFRIQEMRKELIEKNYQKRVKNAIWSAIPNLNVIVAGGPAAIAYSIASQVGIGYMNYRKEKNSALSEKEKEELELRITAIEQFNALRRELFTTAWELAEEFEFDDRLRLTEKQIKQYNQILIDQDELRKYVRLEAIKDKFEAFPPFWYFFGHTACFIAGDETLPLEDWERDLYRKRAKEHFSHYEKLNKFNILREDQMTSAFALEYIDLLLLEEKPDKKKIGELITIAAEMSGNALDVKELCAIAYLKIGDTSKAAELLKQLVNEEYNTITNAKLLSRIYVSQFLNGDSQTAKFDYKTLVMRIGEENADYLFPMPENKVADKQLQTEYLVDQKIILQMDYRKAITELLRKYTVLFNSVIPAPYGYDSSEEYYGYTEKASARRLEDITKVLQDADRRDSFLNELTGVGFRFKYIDLLNEAMEACDDLTIWRESEDHNFYVQSVRANLIQKRPVLKKIQDNMNTNEFSVDDYNKLQHDLSFESIMGTMLEDLKNTVMTAIDDMTSMEEIENAEYNLAEFCQKRGITIAESYERSEKITQEMQTYLDYSIFGADGEDEKQRKERLDQMRKLISKAASELIVGNTSESAVLLPGDEEFNLYFKNSKLSAGALKGETLAIIDDKTRKDCDLVLTEEGVLLIERNKIKTRYRYGSVKYNKDSKHGEALVFEYFGEYYEYSNKNVSIGNFYKLITDLGKKSNKEAW